MVYNQTVLEREARYSSLTGNTGGQSHYHSQAALSLRDMLLGGSSAGSNAGDPDALQASSAAQPARPETLRFAEELAGNVTQRVKELNEQCYEFAGTSSNPLESACNSINGMIKKTQSFLTLMNDVAGPGGEEFLDQQADQFLNGSVADIMLISDAVIAKGMKTAKCAAGDAASCAYGYEARA